MTGSLLAFLLISVAVIVTPGPDTRLTVRNTLLRGRAAGLGTALGVAAGQLIWVLATRAGRGAVPLATEPVFTVVRLLGAAYLVWLGIKLLSAACKDERASPPDKHETSGQVPSMLAGFRQQFEWYACRTNICACTYDQVKPRHRI